MNKIKKKKIFTIINITSVIKKIKYEADKLIDKKELNFCFTLPTYLLAEYNKVDVFHLGVIGKIMN